MKEILLRPFYQCLAYDWGWGGVKNREELRGEHRKKGDEWKRSTRLKRKEVTHRKGATG